MSVGVTILCHTALHRVAQVARHLAAQGAPVVIHVDAAVAQDRVTALQERLADLEAVRFCARHRIDWGGWSIVAAQLDAVRELLAHFPGATHVLALSGACLPLRPVDDLEAYLAAHPDTDFIESVHTQHVAWTVGGLEEERFTLWFPFSFKRQRQLFDAAVTLQRRLGLRREMPAGLVAHLGSQWWCLTRATLEAILNDPARPAIDRFFRNVWIPDESYFQTVTRRHARHIESRSLTLAQFDFQGKPHILYDDHRDMLARSDCFVARKAWPQANGLYGHFLSGAVAPRDAEPDPAELRAAFDRAHYRRTRGRAGLYMQSRFPNPGWENGRTARPYTVLQGFSELFTGFADWLAARAEGDVHGHLFAPEGAQFAGGSAVWTGALTDAAALRDYRPRDYLTNLLWHSRARAQCFQLSPRDDQGIAELLPWDRNAQGHVISGAWALPLFRAGATDAAARAEAARLQRREVALVERLRSPTAQARLRICTLAEAVAEPLPMLQGVLDDVAPGTRLRPDAAPRMVARDGFGRYLQTLRNEGMKPMLTGDFAPEGPRPEEAAQ